MKSAKKIYLQLFLLICFAISLTTASPALSHPTTLPNQIAYLDDCAGDTLRPAIPQSEGAYVANSNTGNNQI